MNTSVLGANESTLPESGDAPPSVQLKPGSCIQGKYVVHGVLGLGGFAVVYDAEHVGLGRHVAVKVMHLAADTPLALLERFRREARTSALASHRNVLEVYDTGTLFDGSPFLVMERLNGENLSSMLRRGPLSLAAAIEVARQLLCGLCALEDVGVVHRDIKPDNLMLHEASDGEPVLKLVDFGIAKRFAIESQAKLTLHGALVGTPQYMSPEQIRGQDVDVQTDLYAAGAVLYEALSGQAPHEHRSFSELVVAVLNAPLRPLRELRANCPAELERIVTRALERSTEVRYASPREMLAELEACARELELPGGAGAFRHSDPIDPAWMTPARLSVPSLSRWWQRGLADLHRPVQLAAGVVVLVASGASLQLWRADEPVHAASAGSALMERPAAPEPASGLMLLPRAMPSLVIARDESLPAPLLGSFSSSMTSHARLEGKPEPLLSDVRPRKARELLAEATPFEVPPVEPPAPAPAVQAPPVRDPAQRASWERTMDAALASMVRGQLGDAMAHYQSATRLEQDEPAAFRGLALVCARLGHGEQARAALRRYLALAPNAADAAQLRARVAAAVN